MTEDQKANLKKVRNFVGWAMFAIGSAIGAMVGLSQSPVVAVALPLLFGLIAGGGGLWVFKVSAEDEGQLEVLKLGMIGVLVFSVGFIISLSIGIILRLDSSPLAEFTFKSNEAVDVNLSDSNLTFREVASALAARRTLALYGSTEEEQRVIVSYFLAKASNSEEQVAGSKSQLKCSDLASALSKVHTRLSQSDSPEGHDEGEIANLKNFAFEAAQLSTMAEGCAAHSDTDDHLADATSSTLSEVLFAETREAVNRAIIERSTNNAADSVWKAMGAFDGGAEAIGQLLLVIGNSQDTDGRPTVLPPLPENWLIQSSADAPVRLKPWGPWYSDGNYLADNSNTPSELLGRWGSPG